LEIDTSQFAKNAIK